MATNGAPTSQADRAAKFDTSIILTLCFWPQLSTAIQNHWGGSAGREKREWFAGAISDLCSDPATASEVDPEYLAEFIHNIMFDEFDVNLEDDSHMETATELCKLRKQCAEGNFEGVQSLERKWAEKGGREEMVGKVIAREVVEEGESGEDEDGDEDDDEDDEEMGGVEVPRERREKPAPEVDEDGFTTVRRR